MRCVMAVLVLVCVAGVASADMPARHAPLLHWPGSWCASLFAGLGVTVGGLWLVRRGRKTV